MRGWTEGMPLPPSPAPYLPSRPLSPSSLFGAARASRANFFSVSPSPPLFLSPPLLPPSALHLPSPAPSPPLSRPFTSSLPPPSSPTSLLPCPPRRYFCMHTSKFSVSLHSPVIMKVHVQSLPLDDFADCLGNIKVMHRSYTFCICTEQPYP